MKLAAYKTAFFVNNVMLSNAYKVFFVIAHKVTETLFGVCIGHHH